MGSFFFKGTPSSGGFKGKPNRKPPFQGSPKKRHTHTVAKPVWGQTSGRGIIHRFRHLGLSWESKVQDPPAPNRSFHHQVSHNQHPERKYSRPRTMLQELRRRISAAIYGWVCPLLTFIYPGFDCGSSAVVCFPSAAFGFQCGSGILFRDK